jgi:hypothetical protein
MKGFFINISSAFTLHFVVSLVSFYNLLSFLEFWSTCAKSREVEGGFLCAVDKLLRQLSRDIGYESRIYYSKHGFVKKN